MEELGSIYGKPIPCSGRELSQMASEIDEWFIGKC
jgi:hypothetical protein